MVAYLSNESFAAASGVVEALDEESQELPSDESQAGDDGGAFPVHTEAPLPV